MSEWIRREWSFSQPTRLEQRRERHGGRAHHGVRRVPEGGHGHGPGHGYDRGPSALRPGALCRASASGEGELTNGRGAPRLLGARRSGANKRAHLSLKDRGDDARPPGELGGEGRHVCVKFPAATKRGSTQRRRHGTAASSAARAASERSERARAGAASQEGPGEGKVLCGIAFACPSAHLANPLGRGTSPPARITSTAGCVRTGAEAPAGGRAGAALATAPITAARGRSEGGKEVRGSAAVRRLVRACGGGRSGRCREGRKGEGVPRRLEGSAART